MAFWSLLKLIDVYVWVSEWRQNSYLLGIAQRRINPDGEFRLLERSTEHAFRPSLTLLIRSAFAKEVTSRAFLECSTTADFSTQNILDPVLPICARGSDLFHHLSDCLRLRPDTSQPVSIFHIAFVGCGTPVSLRWDPPPDSPRPKSSGRTISGLLRAFYIGLMNVDGC